MFVRDSYVFACISSFSFSLLRRIPLYDYTITYISILLLMAIWVISIFGSYEYSCHKCLYICLYVGICTHCSWGFLGVEFLGQNICMYFILVPSTYKNVYSIENKA